MADELRALTRLAFDELGGAAGGIGEIHRAIAERAFRGSPTRVVHDTIAGGVYASVRAGAGLAGRVAGELVGGRGRSLSVTPRGAAMLAVLNGLSGDVLEREGSDLQEPMAIRVDGRVAGADAFHSPTGSLVVFLHGLFETEFSWGFGGGARYGDRLAADAGYTPLYVRYNSGRSVADNGLSLADLLAETVAAWPVEVERIALVGHSMGGLVACSATHGASDRGDEWVRRVSHVVALGTPHTGAPLEQGVHVAQSALGVFPETQPFGTLLGRRSAGIRDLRRGLDAPLLDCATHCFVAATVTRDARHPVGRLVGDWLVLEPSASHRAQETLHVGSAHHLALLNHPAVYARLREWLAPPPG